MAIKDDVNSGVNLEEKAKMHVPFGTVSITPDAEAMIQKAVSSKWVTRGKYVKEFEERFADTFGVKHAIAVSSGTDADAIACAALYDLGAKRGDEIIVPALTFVASGNAILQAGFQPVFVDVKRDTLNIDVDLIEQAITPRTCAIMPVHLMGKPADMDAILALAKKHQLSVIEDAAEAHGAFYKDKMIGSMGDMACFSLYAAHIVSSIEGGMIITNNDALAEACRSLRNHGMVGKFTFERIGFSAKMNELEAAVGIGNVKIFNQTIEKRRENLLFMIEHFKPFDEFFIYIQEADHEKIGPHAFSIIVKETAPFTKDAFVEYLLAHGVDSRNLFQSIPTQCPSYKFLGKTLGDFPEAEYCSDHGTHIGIHQDISLADCQYVIDTVEKFLKTI